MNYATLAKNVLGRLLTPDNWFGAVFYACIFLLGAIMVSRLIRAASNRVLTRDYQLVDRTVVLFLTQFMQILVYIIALIIFFHIVPALNKLGTALLTGVSVMSVIFGLAAQNTLSNLVAGCTLLLYRPFHIDDLVQIATPTGTDSGIVERLTLGYTMLRTKDDRLIIVPNSLMASQVSLNLNRRARHSMAIVPVEVINDAYVGEVRAALLDAAHANENVYKIISCHRQPLEENGAVLSLRAWCISNEAAEQVQSEIQESIRTKFAGRHIVFPLLEKQKMAKAS